MTDESQQRSDQDDEADVVDDRTVADVYLNRPAGDDDDEHIPIVRRQVRDMLANEDSGSTEGSVEQLRAALSAALALMTPEQRQQQENDIGMSGVT